MPRRPRRRWKTFYLKNEIGEIQSCVANFPHEGRTMHVERFPGGGIFETDLSVARLRDFFRFAGVRFGQYVTDTKPSWETTDEEGA